MQNVHICVWNVHICVFDRMSNAYNILPFFIIIVYCSITIINCVNNVIVNTYKIRICTVLIQIFEIYFCIKEIKEICAFYCKYDIIL